MTVRLADIQQRQAAVRQLDSLITAMRGLAAIRAEQSRQKLAGIHDYSRTIAEAIARALDLLPESIPGPMPAASASRPPAAATILFGSEQGFVGGLNEHLLAALSAETLPHDHLLVVGRRISAIAAERGLHITTMLPMVTHPASVAGLAVEIADWLYRGVERISHDRTVHHFLPPARLVEQITAEFVFAQICEAGMLALATENEARLAAMAAAKHNIEDISRQLTEDERICRQTAITEELIELSASALASAFRAG
jgi:F-type H+-transporting ATPase subunit gamma